MPNYQYCSKKSCNGSKDFRWKTRMMRFYIRSNEGKEFRDRIYNLSGQPPKIKKQIFKPIGWLCPRCAKLYYDEGFWRKPSSEEADIQE